MVSLREIKMSIANALKVTIVNEVVAIDTISTINTIYLKFLSGKIQKISQGDLSNQTFLTAQSGGTWANRATTNVYTEGGV